METVRKASEDRFIIRRLGVTYGIWDHGFDQWYGTGSGNGPDFFSQRWEAQEELDEIRASCLRAGLRVTL